MRPKKVILYASGDETEVSLMRFFLDTNGYAFIDAASGKEALAILSEMHPDLVMIDQFLPDIEGEKLAESIKKMCPHVPMAILASGYPEFTSALTVTFRKRWPRIQLLEWIEVTSARKRGPRPGSPSAMRCGENKRRLRCEVTA